MSRRASKPGAKKLDAFATGIQVAKEVSANMTDTGKLLALTKILVEAKPRDDTALELLKSAKVIGVALHKSISQSKVLAGNDFRLMINDGTGHAFLLHGLIDFLQDAIEKLEAAKGPDQDGRASGVPDEATK